MRVESCHEPMLTALSLEKHRVHGKSSAWGRVSGWGAVQKFAKNIGPGTARCRSAFGSHGSEKAIAGHVPKRPRATWIYHKHITIIPSDSFLQPNAR